MCARRWRGITSPPPKPSCRAIADSQGVTPDYVEAVSWMARASLQSQPTGSRRDLCPPDRESVAPIAGQAPARCRAAPADCSGRRSRSPGPGAGQPGRTGPGGRSAPHSLVTYRNTSIHARLQKNLNLLALAGQPAPPLTIAPYLGPKPVSLAQLKGSPVLLFFWAHWCSDCKAEGPIIARIRSEFGTRGLILLAPTQLYGYGARRRCYAEG